MNFLKASISFHLMDRKKDCEVVGSGKRRQPQPSLVMSYWQLWRACDCVWLPPSEPLSIWGEFPP